MAFSKMANVERKSIRDKTIKQQMVGRGWVEVLVPVPVLQELSIQFEPEVSKSIHKPRTTIYAPVWVFGVQYNATQARLFSDWGIVGPLLVNTRDSLREQEMVCAELAPGGSVARSVRDASRNNLDVLHGALRPKDDDDELARED